MGPIRIRRLTSPSLATLCSRTSSTSARHTPTRHNPTLHSPGRQHRPHSPLLLLLLPLLLAAACSLPPCSAAKPAPAAAKPPRSALSAHSAPDPFGNAEVLGFPKPPNIISDGTPAATVRQRPADGNDDGIRQELLSVNQPTPTVSVLTVTILTVLMAAATGLGSLPFFFMEMEEEWAGVCNGVACGVMMAASFDLVSEGRLHDSGSGGACVVVGIILGGLFIVVSQRILEQFGDVKMMDLKGASANRVVLILVIMTLHSFGEGSGVGVSFAGPRGLSQGLLVTIAIAVHNVPEGLAMTLVMVARGVRPRNAMLWSVFTSLPQPLVAVPAFLGANTFTQFLPLCMGFAAGCMIWIVFGEVLPECIKEGANSSHVASAATLSVAFMEALGAFLEGADSPASWHRLVPIAWALLFFLGPLFGSILPLLLSHSLPAPVSPPLLSGLAGGSLLGLALWQPVQLLVTGQMELLPLLSVFYVGCVLHYFCASMGGSLAPGSVLGAQQKVHGGFSDVQCSQGMQQRAGEAEEMEVLRAWKPSLQLSYGIRASVLVCIAVSGHAFAEGLLLGQKAAPGGGLGGDRGGRGGGGVGEIGMRMLLPAAIHGVPRGVAAAAAALGSFSITRSTPEVPLAAVPLALASAAAAGLAGPIGAVASFLFFHSFGAGLLNWLVLACGLLAPAGLDQLLPRGLWVAGGRGGVGGKGGGEWGWSVLDRRRVALGAVLGLVLVVASLMGKRSICAHTSYCNAAPAALT
ncbi:hypothetical protein CLOM_g12642 [Closterium sp. NIES-68]|nr:hypothetical protein CLOM_g12642 [Closterium sp. NIES-68]GJP68581.1 hypothetical protein CLOP_g25262 [Closterium sp. NIES-67]